MKQKKYYIQYSFVFLCCALAPINGTAQSATDQYIERAVECISGHSSVYTAYSCVGEVTNTCLQSLGRTSNNEMTCLDQEASVWDEIYSTSLESLHGAVSRSGVEGADFSLEESVKQYADSYLRSCAFEVGRWPQNALLHNIDSFKCVRDGSFERAIKFYFWNNEFLTLRGK